MYYCKGIDKKGVLLQEYSQSAILHAPHFRRVVNRLTCDAGEDLADPDQGVLRYLPQDAHVSRAVVSAPWQKEDQDLYFYKSNSEKASVIWLF